MSSVNTTILLERWSKAKADIAELEKKIEKYKRIANSIMDKQHNNSISSANHTVSRKNMSRSTIGKRDVPINIWDQYSRSCSYSAYYLSKNK